jgi:hypothetical protein
VAVVRRAMRVVPLIGMELGTKFIRAPGGLAVVSHSSRYGYQIPPCLVGEVAICGLAVIDHQGGLGGAS